MSFFMNPEFVEQEVWGAIGGTGPYPRKKKGATFTPTTPFTQPQQDNSRIMTDWLKANPAAAFQSAISKLNRPMQNWFGSRFGNYWNRYQGDIVNQQNPELQFGDWLQGLNFRQDYLSQSPYQRGFYPSRFAPRTRFLSY